MGGEKGGVRLPFSWRARAKLSIYLKKLDGWCENDFILLTRSGRLGLGPFRPFLSESKWPIGARPLSAISTRGPFRGKIARGERTAAGVPPKVNLASARRSSFLTKSIWRGAIPIKINLARRVSRENQSGEGFSRKTQSDEPRQTHFFGNSPRQTHFVGNSPSRNALSRELAERDLAPIGHCVRRRTVT